MNKLLSSIRNFFAEHSFTIIAVIFALFAVGAYVSDTFMEAQLVFGTMGLWGPVLMGICGLATALVALSYILQEGNSLVQMFRELISKMRTGLRRAFGLPAEIKATRLRTHSEEKNVPTLAKLSRVQKFLLGLGISSGSIIAVGTASFFAISAFFGVVAVAQLCGAGILSPGVLIAGIIVGLAQAVASLFQEGSNTVQKVLTPLAQNCNTSSAELLAEVTKRQESGKPKAEQSAVTGWRSYLPTRRQMLLATTIIFAVVAVIANSSDIFMEAQLVFGLMGLSLPAGLISVCVLIAAAAACTYYFQEGLSIRAGALHLFGIKKLPSQKKPTNNKATRLTALSSARLVVIAVALFGGISAFFGVLSVCSALGVGGPAVLAIAIIAAIAQASASLAQEGRNMIKKCRDSLDAKSDDEESDNEVATSPSASPPPLNTAGVGGAPCAEAFASPRARELPTVTGSITSGGAMLAIPAAALATPAAVTLTVTPARARALTSSTATIFSPVSVHPAGSPHPVAAVSGAGRASDASIAAPPLTPYPQRVRDLAFGGIRKSSSTQRLVTIVTNAEAEDEEALGLTAVSTLASGRARASSLPVTETGLFVDGVSSVPVLATVRA